MKLEKKGEKKKTALNLFVVILTWSSQILVKKQVNIATLLWFKKRISQLVCDKSN